MNTTIGDPEFEPQLNPFADVCLIAFGGLGFVREAEQRNEGELNSKRENTHDGTAIAE